MVLVLLLLPMMVVGQSRQPLIPSARNDRKMAEEREKARLDSIRAASGDVTTTDGTELTAAQDSAIMNPMSGERLGDVKTEVVYDPVTGGYIIHTKIGDTDIATPYLLNEQEYKDYSERELMHRYWQQKIGEVEHNNERKFDITDMKFNIGPADKVFGPGGVQLKLQGSAELLFGFKHQYIDNPSLTQKARNNNIFDFDEKIQVNVNGKVGTRLNFNLNYNTEASFSFDQQNLKLTYKGEEDDIIQSIEAGNVSMDLNSSLIRGTQALFGFKTTLKFGKLKIQGLISQQNSESQTVNSQGGAQLTKFEIGAEKYDENRHFFLGYFFRDKYEQAMSALPYVASGVTINKIEVWVTNKRGTYDQARNIVAFVDLGEVQKHIYNPKWVPNGQVPNNLSNSLYDNVKALPGIRDIQQVSAILQGENLESGDEFEKIESARLLSPSEYTLNSALGFISLKSALNQDEVLAVAYEFTYGGQVYQVGEFSTDASDELKAPATLMLKMLKSSINAPHAYNSARKDDKYGTWDLMMKNVYSLGASSLTSEKFEFYINYRNDSLGTDIQYLPESVIKGKQLLRVLHLDRLDARNNPAPDGKFDFVEGYTVLSGSGRIIFPVLEPFGSYLKSQIKDDKIAEKYVFQELYDSTLVIAQEMTEKNKFTMKGKYKGTSGSQISLGAMNVPRGSVTVTAGGATLIENVDYTVDYAMGTVTILNESILESGTAVQCKLENQSTFSLQRKSLFGAHIEYEFNKDFVIGGTIMHLREKPLTTKVNTGSEPLANTVWGVNATWKTELPWLTNALDKIPWMNVTAPSTFQVSAEFAHLIPGHTNDVGSAGTAYIDDFESTKTNIDVHYPSMWFLASTPYNPSSSKQFNTDDAKLTNDIRYNRNRALLNWYHVDPIFGYPQANTPAHIKDDLNALSDHRTRIVLQDEIYPTKGQAASNEDVRLTVLNMSFYPDQRGPYNVSASEFNSDGKLTNPQNRWGGIMRKLDNTDFEKANIEYIEFWLMDPALTNPNGFDGELYINLGDISEDILRDGKKSFEHGLPISDNDLNRVDSTIWGLVPRTTSTTVAFSNETGARVRQDVGLNGLNKEQELNFSYKGTYPYRDFVNAMRDKVTNQTVRRQWEASPYSPFNDPAGDKYHYYRGTDYDEQAVSILDRYKQFNNTEGNSPDSENQNESYGTASTLTPDIEDINNDNTLNEIERYYQYKVILRPDMMQVGKQHIAEKKVAHVTLRNGEKVDVNWYQFKIPLRGDSATMQTVGNIRNFKSIRFMRMYMTNCAQETHLRFATLDLVRGEWRAYNKDLAPIGTTVNTGASLDVEAVNIEENSSKTPVNYVLPPGVSRQTDPGQAQLVPLNEQAMVLRVHNLSPKDARAVYKNTTYDMRNYKRFQMFVHAEAMEEDPNLRSGDLTCFVRLGTDLKNNYYEYEIPLALTEPGMYNNDNENDRYKVWPAANYFDFPFKVLTDAKTERNKAKRAGNTNVGNTIPYVIYDEANGKPQNRITVLGNPTLQEVECIMIGIRNNGVEMSSGEVWVNEMRLSEFNEQGGVAAMANASLAISDIAQLNVAGQLETAGYGSIESNVLSRNMENNYQLSVSAAMEVGRLFPEKAKLQIPVYVAYSTNTSSPDYNPFDTDIKMADALEMMDTKEERDSLKLMSNTVMESTNFSVTNLKVNVKSKKKDMFYDPANFSISASYNKQHEHSPEIEKNVTTDQKGSFNYAYSFNPKPWEPFKNAEKVKKVKLINELNFYYLPQSWGFNTNMHRTFSHMKLRDFNADPTAKMDLTYSKDFTWDRNFDFKYDLTKNMKFTFQTAMNSTVDEGTFTKEIIDEYHFTNDYYEAWKDTIQRSLAKWGAPYTYQQVFTASWNVPFNRIPYVEALSATASYNANYNWARTTSTQTDQDLGNTISSVQSWQIDGGINFETLYGKSKYWKNMTQKYTNTRRGRAFRPKNYTQTIVAEKGVAQEIVHRLGAEQVTITANDSTGKRVPVTFKVIDMNKISVTPKEDCKALTINIVTKDPNTTTPAQTARDMFAYIGTMIRRVQVTYRKTNSLTMPGFNPQIGFMGQTKQNGIYAPGWDFAFGFIPSDFTERAKANGWLSGDTMVVQPATRAMTEDIDIKINLEPLPGLKIQLSGKRYNANSTSIIYSYDRLQENLTGSFNITSVAIGTIFSRVGLQEENFANSAYDRFIRNRDIVQTRVQSLYDGIRYPTSGFMQGKIYSKDGFYDPKNGKVSNKSADVLVPAFLAAYTGRSADKVSLNPFLGILSILPNWSVTYDGLGKLPWMRDHFRSVTLTHAYTCKYSIGSYSSFSTWVPADGDNKMVGFVRDVTTDNPIPSSAYDISSVSITEAFSPLIGLNLAMKNSLSLKFEYRKQRNLALNVTSVQLSEGHTDEYVVGGGYTVKNLSFISKNKSGVQKKVSNDLKLSVDLSYKNIMTLLRKVEEGITQASSGNKVFSIKIAADYVLSQKINLQLFYDHQSTLPMISSSYPVKADNVGINVKLMLTR